MTKRSFILKVASGMVASVMFAAAAHAHDIRVSLDQAEPLRLSAPAQGVAIGNPAIAGVTVQNERLLFVTGRQYGTTNLVVVGGDGRVIYTGLVRVTPDESGAVMMTRGAPVEGGAAPVGARAQTERLECTPVCRTRPDVGEGRALPGN